MGLYLLGERVELAIIFNDVFVLVWFVLFYLTTILMILYFQILTSVRPTSITVIPMLSVITPRDRITAHVVLDTLEMEHHAPVNHHT